MTAPGLDILLASHNGARTLPLMLAALRGVRPPKRPWRILVVDNASTDNTRALLDEAARTLPIEVLSCPQPGKMTALKRGAALVRGDLVVFTDDDIEPEPQWLEALEAAADAAPEIGLFGGAITPKTIDEVSPWYAAARDHHAELFALSDHPDGPVDAPAHIFGPNFLIRSEFLDVLEEVGDGLGPSFAKKKTYAMGQDTMIMNRLVARGVKAQFVRSARVRHFVRGGQTGLEAMLDRAERHGRGAAIRYVEAKQRSIVRRAKLAVQHAATSVAVVREGVAPSPDAFNALWKARWSLGALKGAVLGPYT